MLERKINLKRNSCLLFLATFLPLVFWSGVIAIWAYFGFNSEISKWISFLGFVIAFVFSVRVVVKNKGCLAFSEDGISVNGNEKILIIDVKNIVCDDKSRRINLILQNYERITLVNFSYVSQLGYGIYHKVKAELCRYYPEKTSHFEDVSIHNYIKTGLISDNVEREESFGRARLAMLLFFELVFTFIPLSLGIISTAWVFCKFLILLLQAFVLLLNIFK